MKPFKVSLLLLLLVVNVTTLTIHLKYDGNGPLILFIQLSGPAVQNSAENRIDTETENYKMISFYTLTQLLINAAILLVLVHYIMQKYAEELGEEEATAACEASMAGPKIDGFEDLTKYQDAYYYVYNDNEEMVSFADVYEDQEALVTTASLILQ
ncbi:unnamed protein product [Caenorhabditis brenneri]